MDQGGTRRPADAAGVGRRLSHPGTDVPRPQSAGRAAHSQEFESALPPRPRFYLQYQLHAYHRQQHIEQAAVERQRWVLALAVAGTALALLWMYLAQRRRQERERQRIQTQTQIDQA